MSGGQNKKNHDNSSKTSDGDFGTGDGGSGSGDNASGSSGSGAADPNNPNGSNPDGTNPGGGNPMPADEVVDGQEVFKDCNTCFARAQQLAGQINMTAAMNKTINLGFYKIPPSRGLCDVHFMQNLSDDIADHEGQDSVLGNQIALYCPCNCGRAVDESQTP